MKRKKIQKRQRKIKHTDEDAYWERIDEEDAAAWISTDVKDSYDLKEEDIEVTNKVEAEGICPECGGSLIQAIESGGSMGVGKTYAQLKMKPWSVSYEVVCSKCGLVLRKSVRQVHR